MFQVFRNAFKLPDLRKKLLYTLMIIVIFRIGAAIPVPFLDASALKDMVSGSGNFLGYLDVLTGGAFANATIFAMSITPYINASIIIQLLTVAIPVLERMQKEGEEGRKKLNKITRYTTIVLGLTQATAYYFLVRNNGAVKDALTKGWEGWFAAIVIILIFTAGTALIMWLGEQINEKGIGNGISIILFAGIISRGPSAIGRLIALLMEGSAKNLILVPVIVVIFVAMISFIIVMTNAERKIPVQYAKRVVGRKQYGGQSSFIPVKVSMSGVMPIIFASSMMSIPGTISAFVPPKAGTFWAGFMKAFDYTGFLYASLYFLLIIAFNYFYVAIQYNPIEIANNLRKNNGGIPGIRPGKPTSDFVSRVISKITFVGAIFLGAIAIAPIAFTAVSGINIALGGTSILIIVGVALETVRTLESQMMMRHHKGFLE
jgi:preprotein translocase subunit SecY